MFTQTLLLALSLPIQAQSAQAPPANLSVKKTSEPDREKWLVCEDSHNNARQKETARKFWWDRHRAPNGKKTFVEALYKRRNGRVTFAWDRWVYQGRGYIRGPEGQILVKEWDDKSWFYLVDGTLLGTASQRGHVTISKAGRRHLADKPATRHLTTCPKGHRRALLGPSLYGVNNPKSGSLAYLPGYVVACHPAGPNTENLTVSMVHLAFNGEAFARPWPRPVRLLPQQGTSLSSQAPKVVTQMPASDYSVSPQADCWYDVFEDNECSFRDFYRQNVGRLDDVNRHSPWTFSTAACAPPKTAISR